MKDEEVLARALSGESHPRLSGADVRKAPRRGRQCLFPSRFPKPAVSPEHRPRQPARMVHGRPHQETSLNAGLAAIRGAIRVRNGAQNPAVFQPDPQPASLSAERANRPSFGIGQPLVPYTSLRERARGTDIHAGAAEPAFGFDKAPVHGRADNGL